MGPRHDIQAFDADRRSAKQASAVHSFFNSPKCCIHITKAIRVLFELTDGKFPLSGILNLAKGIRSVFYGYSVTPQETPLQTNQHRLQNLFVPAKSACPIRIHPPAGDRL